MQLSTNCSKEIIQKVLMRLRSLCNDFIYTSFPNRKLRYSKAQNKQQHTDLLSHDITSLCESNKLKDAVDLLQHDAPLHQSVYALLLRQCGDSKSVEQGKRVHRHIMANHSSHNDFVSTNLVTMYGKLGCLEEAKWVFDGIENPNIHAWNSIVRAFSSKGLDSQVIQSYQRMRILNGVLPDSFMLVNVFKSCARLGNASHGMEAHCDVVKSGIELDAFTANALSTLYAKCGHLESARQVFDKMPDMDIVSWNGIISAYAGSGKTDDAVSLLRQMLAQGISPNSSTLLGFLPTCTLEIGNQIHGFVCKNGYYGDCSVVNAITSVYARSGSLDDATLLFERNREKDVSSWNAMISGYVQNGDCPGALRLFRKMQALGVGLSLPGVTSVLSACSRLSLLEMGKQVHAVVCRRDAAADVNANVIVSSALMDMYAKCGSLEEAWVLFEKMQVRDLVAWNAIIGAFGQHSWNGKVVELFMKMQHFGIAPDAFTLVSVLCACAKLTILQKGKEVQDYVFRVGLESDVFVCSALLDMYAKCGALEDAYACFVRMEKKDLVSWNSMIVAFGAHGYATEAVQLFSEMKSLGIRPDEVTFIGILSACSHAGLVEDGCKYFDEIRTVYSISTTMEHYNCMVDLLSRSGKLHEAYEFVKSMPLEPNHGIWGSLLGACRSYCNLELAEKIAGKVFELDPQNDGNYVLLSNIYASKGRWDDVQEIRKLLKSKNIEKTPGCSWIELKNNVHVFLRGCTSHPQCEEIYAKLQHLTCQMKEQCGYVPNTSNVLYDVEDDDKEFIIFSHSERLAIAFGLINTYNGAPIRITKNLRVCDDCHIAIKFISKLTKREIIIRDAKRFHHYKDGLCSCGDYW